MNEKYSNNGSVEGEISDKVFESARTGYRQFLNRCEDRHDAFRLTPDSEVTPYALCFALFGMQLLRDDKTLCAGREEYVVALRDNIRNLRAQFLEPPVEKPYRQLLTFTLSALALLNALESDPLEELVIEQLPGNVPAYLEQVGALEGRPQSGNQSMFLAIFLLHARDYLGHQMDDHLKLWVDLHLSCMNRFGFWGNSKSMTHLQFQNGYHQYEIMEYLGIENPRARDAVNSVRSLADPEGHFAPYPGGGGCYDYDAVFVLTATGGIPDNETATLLRRNSKSLLAEQTHDGGWCENRWVRPRSFSGLVRFAGQIGRAIDRPALLRERLRYALTLQRPRHNRIHTHWSIYSRQWHEADLWDSWFRMLTLARAQVALEPERATEWGFINYPGIGYHSSLAATSNDS